MDKPKTPSPPSNAAALSPDVPPSREAGKEPASKRIALAAILGPGVSRFSASEQEWIAEAYDLAERSHKDVLRLSGNPYIQHPVSVARTLMDLGLDCASVCAGLLHDTIEDTTVTFEDLKARFPEPVPELVSGVTKISSLNFRSSREEQVENFRKMVLAMARDIRVILIKLADRLHNMQTLQCLPAAKQKRVARTTMEVYAPLAHRLGIYRIKSELEDHAMRYLYPEAYHDLRERIAAKRDDRERQIQESIEFLRAKLEEHGIKAEVTGRPKHFWSIYQKMRNQGLSFEEIYDLNALRVICGTRTECYGILGVIHSIWKPVPEHFSDYVALPKANMYQSIHTKVIGLNSQLTEIQVRTWDMHQVAEEGIAAHWQYKEGRKESPDFGKKLVWVRQMVDWLTDSNDPNELLHDLKREVFDDKVFCFTPRGDVIEVTKGATVLDFAYRIHTDLGHRCVGGKVNQKFVPLRTELKMGDMVEILTSKTPHPSPDWLKILTTPRARVKVRHWLKQRDYQRNLTAGRDMLLKALLKAGLHPSTQEIHEILERKLSEFHVRSVEDLFSEIGFGSIPPSMVVARFHPASSEREPRSGVRRPSKKRKAVESPVLVDGMPNALTRFAQCCKPQPGEGITGLVTRGRGVSIHRSECPYLSRWLAESQVSMNRLVPVSWSSDGAGHKQLGIRVTCWDRTGVLRDVSDAIAGMNIMIVASYSRSNPRNGQGILRFTVLVKDEDELNKLMNRLREITDVVSVTRDSKFR